MGNGTPFGGLVAAVLGLSVTWWMLSRRRMVADIEPAPVVETVTPRADIVPADLLDLLDRQLSQATESDERLKRYLVLARRAQWFPVPWILLAGGGLGLIAWASSGSWASATGVGVASACGAAAAWFIKLTKKTPKL
ncbi:hypothetical protein [Lentzea sp.]|uniref:hypothetical protein n=1 Tax=Lentzea sp. TaxID=56099 RepID=UPI002ED2AC27